MMTLKEWIAGGMLLVAAVTGAASAWHDYSSLSADTLERQRRAHSDLEQRQSAIYVRSNKLLQRAFAIGDETHESRLKTTLSNMIPKSMGMEEYSNTPEGKIFRHIMTEHEGILNRVRSTTSQLSKFNRALLNDQSITTELLHSQDLLLTEIETQIEMLELDVKKTQKDIVRLDKMKTIGRDLYQDK